MSQSDQEKEPLVVHDKRRLDPETGEVRHHETAQEQEAMEHAPLSTREDELLADLQRVTAEYANYRKRVDRDRTEMVEHATIRLLDSLLPLLDAVDLARQHGDLEGAFKLVGEGLEQVAERQGLERVGKVGDPFDPTVHHALMHAAEDQTVDFPVVAQVLQPGWRLKSGRVLRPAGVAVADPVSEPSAVPEESTDESEESTEE